MSTSSTRATATRPPGRLPFVVPVLAVGTFLMCTTEYIVAGLLPQMASDFHVSLSQVGLLISAFAVGMVVGAPIGSVVTLVGLGGALATPPMTGLVLATAPEHQAARRGSSR